MRLLSLSLALLFFAPADPSSVGPAEPTDAAPSAPAPEPEPAAPEREEKLAEVETRDEPVTAAPVTSEVLDTVLDCGLRVRIAQDDSLPVAAVVMAIETGTMHDPVEHPGLVHALAFHLLMGSNELRPGQVLADVVDYGGLATVAVGTGQVRYESLTPWPQLDHALALEARRLRAPTTRHELWLKALSYARRDVQPRPPYPFAARQLVWDEPGLGHGGREVDKTLTQMPEGAVGAQLANLFRYSRATLVVVAPSEPKDTLAQVKKHFDAIPAAPRTAKAPKATPTPAPEGSSKRFEAAKQKGNTYVFPVAPDPASQAWAETLCATLNRLPTLPGEAKKTRVACMYQHDPRHPAMMIRGGGPDRFGSIVSRIEALERGEYAKQWKSAAAGRTRDLERRERQPLTLAILLARAGESLPATNTTLTLADYSGRSGVDPEDFNAGPPSARTYLDATYAVHLAPPRVETKTEPVEAPTKAEPGEPPTPSGDDPAPTDAKPTTKPTTTPTTTPSGGPQ